MKKGRIYNLGVEVDSIYNENCLLTMERMNAGQIDLALTSPPYDSLRNYEGFDFPFPEISKELFRVVKVGGVLVWIVGDQVKKGSESGTSFKQALAFMEVGFRLHDTMIYRKINPTPNSGNRYQQCFEFMFVFSKGKPATTNISKRESKTYREGLVRHTSFARNKEGELNKHDSKFNKHVPNDNIWEYTVGGGHSTLDKIAFQHPAIFPEQLALDHILSWSNKGEVVYDPFMGSGTTAKMAIKSGRNYIGSEISSNYCKIGDKRLRKCA